MSIRIPSLVTLAVIAAGCWAATPAPAFRIGDFHTTDTGEIAASPPRDETSIRPGQKLVREVSFQNRTGEVRSFTIRVQDIGTGRALPSEMFSLTDSGPFGASDWIRVDRTRFTLKHGQLAALRVDIEAPRDIEPGSYYAAVVAYSEPDDSSSGKQGAATARVSGGIGSQFFFDVPGPRHPAGSIINVGAPRVVWRERDTYVALDATYRNDGNVTDVVGGTVALASPFGKEVGRARSARQVVLRGGAREYRFLWNEPPWVGRFTPRIALEGESGTSIVRELPSVWIIPSWKYILIALAAILLPAMWRLRERRRGRALRAELAEAGSRGEDPWTHPDDPEDS